VMVDHLGGGVGGATTNGSQPRKVPGQRRTIGSSDLSGGALIRPGAWSFLWILPPKSVLEG
jgi:hypothetical protein